MSEFLGARISLISKSDIRYSGVLHEINSEESTVSLENVVSYGTEGRRGQSDEEIPPADQIYEYIVFRGSDVKDLRIEGTPAPNPAPVPNDPAILGARPRPTNANNNAPPLYAQGPPQGPPQQAGRGGPSMPSGPMGSGGPGFMPNTPMPPNAGGWGTNGPSPRNFPYPPPPGWYPPQGPGFGPNGAGGPPGPGGPQWNNGYYPPGPGQPPFMSGPPGAPGPQNVMQSPPQQRPPPQTQLQQGLPPQQQQVSEVGTSPAGAASDKQKGSVQGSPEPEPKSLRQPPVLKSPAATAQKAGQSPTAALKQKAVELPTGPQNVTRIAPIVPLPEGLVKKAASQTIVTQVEVSNPTTVRDATMAAKAAVAVAMAKLDAPGGSPVPAATTSAAPAPATNGSSTMMDNLTRKVNEMRVNASQAHTGGNNQYYNNNNGGGYSRGRGGRNGYGPRPPRVEVPDTPFDFASANAKFKKDEVVKEVGAGSGDVSDAAAPAEPAAGEASATEGNAGEAGAYSKTRSFFDNISSEAKDRASSIGQRVGGREWRGEEQRKNMETFGQGSVDGGYRGYRGRGRGRGRGGNIGRGRGNSNGYRRYNNAVGGEQQQ